MLTCHTRCCSGRHVSVVARPEIVVDVKMSPTDQWQEVEFRYKPGDVNRRLPIVVPHQPRLDWQMW